MGNATAPGADQEKPGEADLPGLAADVLTLADRRGWKIATAESCTGGQVSEVLTRVEGLSHCFDRGFVVYSDEAKREMLAVSPATLETHGAVSERCAAELAAGAIHASSADIAVAITGFAGKGGDDEPSGLVYLAVALKSGAVATYRCDFASDDRAHVCEGAIREALAMLKRVLEAAGPRLAA